MKRKKEERRCGSSRNQVEVPIRPKMTNSESLNPASAEAEYPETEAVFVKNNMQAPLPLNNKTAELSSIGGLVESHRQIGEALYQQRIRTEELIFRPLSKPETATWGNESQFKCQEVPSAPPAFQPVAESLDLPPSPPPLPPISELVVVKSECDENPVRQNPRTAHEMPDQLTEVCQPDFGINPLVSGTTDTGPTGDEHMEVSQIDTSKDDEVAVSDRPPKRARAHSPTPSPARSPTPSPAHSPIPSSRGYSPTPSPHSSPSNSPMAQTPTEDAGIILKNEEARARYNRLIMRSIINTRGICQTSMKALGIFDDVQSLTTRIGLWSFLVNLSTAKTYKRPTIEFLSTYDFDGTKISFQLYNQHYDISIENLNAIFEFPPRGVIKMGDTDTSVFWKQITKNATTKVNKRTKEANKKTKEDNKKTTCITHPSIRYIQRVLAHSIFARGETGSTVTKNELFFLSCMLSKKKIQPNIGYFLACHIKQVADEKKLGGLISLGGIVTLLANHEDIDCMHEDEATGSNLLDLKCLQSMKLINSKKDYHGKRMFYHIPKSGKEIKFPLEPLVIENPNTWIATMRRSASDDEEKERGEGEGEESEEEEEEEEHEVQPTQIPRRLTKQHACPSCGETSQPSNSEILEAVQRIQQQMDRYEQRLDRYEQRLDRYECRQDQMRWMQQQFYSRSLHKGMSSDPPPPNLFDQDFHDSFRPASLPEE